MKALILKRPCSIDERPLSIAEVDTPIPGPKEILLKIMSCGICHTDLHIVEGELKPKKLPIIPGHQSVGVVAAMGKRVTRFRKGDRVGVAWLNSTCGKCEFCQKEKENLCEKAKCTGYDVDGGYAGYAVVSEDFAHPIPRGFSEIEAAPLFCAGVIGFRALRLAEIEKGRCLGLFGFGASAHIVIQIAKHWGCQVFVFTRSEEHRKLAKELGADWTGRAEDSPPARLNSAVIFAPAGKLVLDALRVLGQ